MKNKSIKRSRERCKGRHHMLWPSVLREERCHYRKREREPVSAAATCKTCFNTFPEPPIHNFIISFVLSIHIMYIIIIHLHVLYIILLYSSCNGTNGYHVSLSCVSVCWFMFMCVFICGPCITVCSGLFVTVAMVTVTMVAVAMVTTVIGCGCWCRIRCCW